MISNKRIKVLIIEDSIVMQNLLTEILSADPIIKIVGVASNPLEARELIKKTNPDVLTLDVIMPQMDGIAFLKNLMRLRPMPVVMISSLTSKNTDVALEALALGAIDCFPKPTKKELDNIARYSEDLINSIKKSSETNIRFYLDSTKLKNLQRDSESRMDLHQEPLLNDSLIAIGASVGGIEAVEALLTRWPRIMPGIVIVQHIKKELNSAFQKRLDKLCALTVLKADNQEKILPGHVYIAPPDIHLTVRKGHFHYTCILEDKPPVNGHCPSVDVLFNSVAKAAGANAIGILLTGMGTDGAQGLKAIKTAGGSTLVQDEKTSVVWGMPGTAVKINATDYVLPLDEIHEKVLRVLEEKLQP